MKAAQKHLYPFEVSFDLLDAGGVVYHPNYLVICDRARSASMTAMGYSFNAMWADGYAFAVYETQSRYLKPIRQGHPSLCVVTEIQEASNSSLSVHQEIVELPDARPGFIDAQSPLSIEARLYTLDVKLVCVFLEAFKAVRIPERMKSALGSHKE